MSTVYNLEPPPTAQVVLQTTTGDILLELFAKQTPLASRNFLQLCLDGYYNGTIFHRLVPGFVIQGGDPTGTGEGGEAIYDGGVFADEFHSRLKFNRRGLLGMANGGGKNDNGSQFFLTLGTTEELNGRNTMFGRVVGDTIYNLMKMADAELMEMEGSERPLYPTTITGTEILVNPFEDMTSRKAKTRRDLEQDEPVKKKPKRKAGKALLSFGGEEEDGDGEPIPKKAKFNTKLVSTDSVQEETLQSSAKKVSKPLRQRLTRSPSLPSVLKLNKRPVTTQLPLPQDEEPSRSASSSPEPTGASKASSVLDRTNAQIAELKASMRRNVPAAAAESPRKLSTLEQMIPANAIRGRNRNQANKDAGMRVTKALEMLTAFRARLDQAPPEVKRPQVSAPDAPDNDTMSREEEANDEEANLCDLHFIANCQSCKFWNDHAASDAENDDDDDKGWMSHALSFEKDRLGKDLSWKKKNEEELIVIDPREKAKDIKEEQRAKKAAKGSSTRAWDKDRDRGRIPERLATAR